MQPMEDVERIEIFLDKKTVDKIEEKTKKDIKTVINDLLSEFLENKWYNDYKTCKECRSEETD